MPFLIFSPTKAYNAKSSYYKSLRSASRYLCNFMYHSILYLYTVLFVYSSNIYFLGTFMQGFFRDKSPLRCYVWSLKSCSLLLLPKITSRISLSTMSPHCFCYSLINNVHHVTRGLKIAPMSQKPQCLCQLLLEM